MSAADKLAQVLAEHNEIRYWADNKLCGCGECINGIDIEAHQAAVVLAHLTAEGWAQGREEWGVQGAIIHPVRSYDHGAATTLHAKHGMPVVRRRVTDWEPVDA